MTSPALSPTRFIRVAVTGRTRCLVPPQHVPRSVVLITDPEVRITISSEPLPELRNAPYQQNCVYIRPGSDIPKFALAAGQGLWCVNEGPLAEMTAIVSYTTQPDPDEAVKDYALLIQADHVDGYDEAVDECWELGLESDEEQKIDLTGERT